MINQHDDFIDFDKFEKYVLLEQNESTMLITSKKKASPNKKYLFKIFNFKCCTSINQKIIFDKFHQTTSRNCQYLLCYKHIANSFPSEKFSQISNSIHLKYAPTFSMRYFSVKTLEYVLKKPEIINNWKIENYLKCLFAVAEAMLYLHDRLICHGNLCPSNIVIDEAGQFYVCDFDLYPIKKLYIDEKNLFNEIYKDPNMENNEPTFKNDIYSFGILIYELLFAFYRSNKEIDQKDLEDLKKLKDLKDFIKFSEENNFKLLGNFFSQLVQSCLNQSLNERTTFNEILNKFKTTKVILSEVRVQQLYNEFSQSNYLDNLVANKNEYAIYKKGKMYHKGTSCKKDIEKAKEYYYKIISSNNSEVQNKLGILLLENSKNEKDKFDGARYLKLSAEQGNIHGMCNYGMLLLNGYGSIEKDIEKGKEYLKKSAELDYSYAQVYYCCTLIENESSQSDIQEALNYIKKAIRQNNVFSFYIYGILIEEGIIGDINYNSAFNYFKIAAEMGYEQARIKCDEYIKSGKEKFQLIRNEIKQYKWKSEIILNELFQEKLNSFSKIDHSSSQIKIQSENNQEKEKLSTQKDILDQSKNIQQQKPQLIQNNNNNQNLTNSPQLKLKISDDSMTIELSRLNQIESNKKIDNQQDTDKNSVQMSKHLNYEHFTIHDNKNIDENSSIKTKQNNEINSLLSTQMSDDEDPLFFKFDDVASHTDDLIEIAKIIEKSDPNSASKIYKKTLQYGNLNSVFKCIEFSTSFPERLYYLQLAVEKNVPGAFSILRKNLLKEMSLKKDEEEIKEIAKIFEKYEDYSDAAYVYKKIKDKINFENCYNKAIENKDKIEDKDQLYSFGILLEKKNDHMLSLEILQKSHEIGNPKAKSKIDRINIKIKSMAPETELSIKETPSIPEAELSVQETLSAKETQSITEANSSIKEALSTKETPSVTEEESPVHDIILAKDTSSVAKSDSSIKDESSTKELPLKTEAESSVQETSLTKEIASSSLETDSSIKNELSTKEKSSITEASLIKEMASSSLETDSSIKNELSTKEKSSLTEASLIKEMASSSEADSSNKNELSTKEKSSLTEASLIKEMTSSSSEADSSIKDELSTKEETSLIKETTSSSEVDSSIKEALSTKETPLVIETDSSQSAVKLSTTESLKQLEMFFLPSTKTPSSLSSSGPVSKISSPVSHPSKDQLKIPPKPLPMPLVSSAPQIVASESSELKSLQEFPTFNDIEEIPPKSIDNNEEKTELQTENNQENSDNKRKRKAIVRRKPVDYEREWNFDDRDNLVKFITCFGWDRWDKSRRLSSLKQPVQKIKLAARAFLRKLISYSKDPTEFETARTILKNSMSKKFDPSFENEEKSEEVDNDFMNSPVMADDEFVQTMEQESINWIKQIELLYYVNISCEKANYKKNYIVVPEVDNSQIGYYWTNEDDQCLIFGTWKCGYGKYDDMKNDENITFTYKKLKGSNLPPENDLNLRLQELVEGIKKNIDSEKIKENEDKIVVDGTLNISNKPISKPKKKSVIWAQNDRLIIFQKIGHDGVYLKNDGSLDWSRFRNECKFFDKTDDQVSNYVMKILDSEGENSGDYKRFYSLIYLRKLFIDHSSDDLLEYMSFFPRRKSEILKNWDYDMELTFYYEISQKGWGHCEEILKTPIGDVFNDDFPCFLTEDLRVINRLERLFEFIKKNSLKDLRKNKK